MVHRLKSVNNVVHKVSDLKLQGLQKEQVINRSKQRKMVVAILGSRAQYSHRVHQKNRYPVLPSISSICHPIQSFEVSDYIAT